MSSKCIYVHIIMVTFSALVVCNGDVFVDEMQGEINNLKRVVEDLQRSQSEKERRYEIELREYKEVGLDATCVVWFDCVIHLDCIVLPK